MAESNRASLVNITIEKREIVPFCVLEPPLSKMAFCLKIRKTRYLRLLANKVLKRQWGRRAMSQQFPVETAVCTEYQRLLADCQRALEIWDEHRAEVCQSRLRGKEAGDELLRLQAKYARLELTQYCSATQTTAYSVSWCQGSRDKFLRIAQMPSPATKCTLERRRSPDVSVLNGMRRTKNPAIEIP